MTVKLANNASSTLAADIADGATALTIQSADAAMFPTLGEGDWFPVTVIALTGDFEIMKCTARSSATLTVERAQEETAALAFLAGARVTVRLTAAAISEMTGSTVNSDDLVEGVVQLLMTVAERGKLAALGTAATKDTGASAGNVPVLDGGGKLAESTLPAIAITDTTVVASQAAMLALTAQTGDIAVRSDINKTFALAASPASTLANWVELRTPTDAVLSVAGKTGAVTLEKGDVGLGNVDNTSDTNKVASGPIKDALDGKSGTGHTHSDATTSVAGFMSSTDKSKLDAVGTMANRAVTISSSDPSGGVNGDVWFKV